MLHKIEWNGEILSIRKVCKKEGISEYAVYSRKKETGEDFKAILLYYLNKPNRGNREKIDLNGIIADISTHCKRLGISYDSVKARIRKTGESAKEALLYVFNKPNKGNREKIELNGKFLSVKKYCDQLNYDYGLVTRYKRSCPDKSYTEILKEWETLPQDEILNNIHLFEIWHNMMDRCYNPKNPAYKWYGGKKINPTRVYEKWQDYTGFKEDNWEEYTNHVKQYGRNQTSIDREDESGDYCPSNCSWSDWEQQGRNKSSTKYLLPCNNYQKTLLQHCNKNGYNYKTIIDYIKQYNLTPDKALAKYLKERKNK